MPIFKEYIYYTMSVFLFCVFASKVNASDDLRQLNIGIGHGPQAGKYVDAQKNSNLDINYTFQSKRFESNPNVEFRMGVGYSYLTTNIEQNSKLHVVTVLPSIRYNFEPNENFQTYIGVAAGPSLMSGNQLGYQEQGSHFLFNDYITIGAYLGKNKDWEVSWSWRHLSNADMFLPNPGIDVPFSFSLGKRF
ncbi:acyloxyacyl hydrolase [Vibrio tubiashii]|uniref:acyloxyacyl hydrolase n=1 Tax=Vibrio tubiashii TaxID=29498 RepID=UPI00349E9C66